ncbi:MAG TPA: hypothetical protein VG096_22325 [Bryobacteraceae bacterium]|jgi:hypothetical protein|nr:hypothetical protein [Bryobacteraceae bacterium]
MDLLVSVLFIWSLEAAVLLLYCQYRAVRRHTASLDRDWLYQLSVDRYRPMLRLLDEQDFCLLRHQPGFTPDMAKRVRSQRCQIFRQYLGSLHNDFQQVTLALKVVMAQSAQDRPDLARVLVRMQILFTLGLVLIRLRLVLYGWGLAKVDISPLIGMFDFLRERLRMLAPVGNSY